VAGASKLKSAASIVTFGSVVAFFVVLYVSFALDPELLPQAATSSTAAATATARVVIILRLIGSSPGPIAAHGGCAVTRRRT